MAYRKRCTSSHSTFHCGQHHRRGGKGNWEKQNTEDLDLPEITPTARAQDAHRPQDKHTPVGSVISPFEKVCKFALSATMG